MRSRPAIRALALAMLTLLPALATAQVVFQRVVTEDVTLIPGTNEEIIDINNRPAINDSGDLVFSGELRTDSGDTPRAVIALINNELRVLARQGEVAPGTGGAEFASFEDVRIADDGHVLFLADLSSANGVTINFTNRNGYWLVAPNGTVTKVAQEGDPSPASGNPAFTSMSSTFFDYFEVGSGGVVTFTGEFAPLDDTGLFYFNGTTLSRIAQDGNLLFDPIGRALDFSSIGNLSVVMNDAGDVVFGADTAGQGGQTDGPDVVLYSPGGVQLLQTIAANGNSSPAIPGGTYAFVGNPRFNDDGQIVFAASTIDTGGSLARRDLFLSDGTTTRQYVQESVAELEGISPPDIDEVSWTFGGWELSNNGTDGPGILLETSLFGPGTTFDNDEGYWLATDNTSRRLLRADEPAPGLAVNIADDVGRARSEAINGVYDAIVSVVLQRDNLPLTATLDEVYYLSTAASPAPQVLLEDSASFQYEPNLPAGRIADVRFKDAGFGGQRAINDAGQFTCIVSIDTDNNDFGDRDVIVRGFIRNNAGVNPFQQFGGTPPVANTPPTVTITEPLTGSTFAPGTPITFSADITDAEDGANDAFTGTIQWAAGDRRLIPFGTARTVTVSDLSPGLQTVRITVTDSEGLTAEDAIEITISEELAPVNTPPTVSITTPSEGQSFQAGTPVIFTGVANDPDGPTDLSSQISWTSNLDGPIGNGAGFNSTTLSVGSHLITASVTDAASATTTDTVTITVTAIPMVPPPTVTITSPAAGSTFVTGQLVAFNGSATNSSGDDISSTLSWTSSPAGFSGNGPAFSDNDGVVVPGTYTITATATDAANGQVTGSASVTITVTQSVNPLLAMIPVESVVIPEVSGRRALTGNDVAASGDTLAVASINASDATGPASGAVTVLTGPNGATQQTLRLNDAQAYDLFGATVDIDGRNLVIGAPGRDPRDLTTGTITNDAGSIVVATRPRVDQTLGGGGALPDEWAIEQVITGPMTSGAYFGTAVAISGDLIVATAPMFGADAQPVALVYRQQPDGTFALEATLTPPAAQVDQYFGFAATVSVPAGGNAVEPPLNGTPRETIAIGAPASGSNANGYVQLYRNIDGVWTAFETIQPEQDAGDFFATAIALNQSWLAIGARGDDLGDQTSSLPNAGVVYTLPATNIFNPALAINIPNFAFANAEALRPDDPAANAFFGIDVALDNGQRRVNNVTRDDSVIGVGSLRGTAGRAYSFAREGAAWSGRRVDGAAGADFGSAVDVAGANLAVGAPGSPTSGVAVSSNADVQACNRFDRVQPFGVIDLADFMDFADAFNVGAASADVNDDGNVDALDQTAFVTAIDQGC